MLYWANDSEAQSPWLSQWGLALEVSRLLPVYPSHAPCSGADAHAWPFSSGPPWGAAGEGVRAQVRPCLCPHPAL
jgi:hypothetical protein